MSNNLVIVALPADDDPIWKISSEKKPHLTLCFLGDAESNQNVDRIMLFVEHAVAIAARGPFYLEVDHRDVLGEDKADVFMFRKDWSFRWVNQFRNQLLKNNDIRTAYESVEQFPEYQPHITLGYPETPAHEDKIPEYGINLVRFDRIGVWTGDFEGPDWRLEWPESEALDEVAWGVDMDLERAAAGRYALEHVGVKGMKWGQRKTEAVTVNGKAKMVTPKKSAKLDTKWSKNQFTLSKGIERHNAMADHFNGRIGALNDKHAKDDFSKEAHDHPEKWSPKYKDYMTQVGKLQEQSFRHAVEQVHGTSPSGKLKAQVDLDADGQTLRMSIKNVEVKHAATETSEEVFLFKITRNPNGLITKTEPVKDDVLAQTSGYGETFVAGLMDNLTHIGVKGMRWGVRKPPPAAVIPTATSRVPHGNKRKTTVDVQGGQNHPAHEDAIKVAVARVKLAKSGPAALSNNELRDVANRLQLENQVSALTSSKGKRFVSRQLETESQRLTREGLKTGGKAAVKKATRGAAVAATTAALV